MSVAENFKAIHSTLQGRAILVGVSKGQPPGKIREAMAAGLTDIGNNYTQDGAKLRSELSGGTWHFIGAIQSRKVKELLDYDLIQSLDRVEIAEAFQTQLAAKQRRIDALIEINLGGETSKAGIAPEALEDFLNAVHAFDRIRIRGIMVLPPPLLPIENRRPYFHRAREIFDAHAALGWDLLSMGTSDDYALAVEEGSTMVRLGTILFGPRA